MTARAGKTGQSVKRLRYTIALNAENSELCLNGCCGAAFKKGGAYSEPLKFTAVKAMDNPLKLYASQNESVILLDGSNFIRVYKNGFCSEMMYFMSDKAEICDYRDYCFYTDGVNGTFNFGKSNELFSEFCMLRLGVCGERLTGISDNRFFTSEPLDKEDVRFEMVILPQFVYEIQSLNGDAYLLGNSVYKVTFDADITRIKVETLSECEEKPVRFTPSSCNGSIVYATENGLRKIVNGKIVGIFRGLDGFFDFKTARCAFYGGLYYMSCKYANGRGGALLALDTDGEKIVKTLDGYCDLLINSNGELWAVRDGQLGYFSLSQDTETVLTFGGIDMGSARVKRARFLTIDTAYDVDLKLSADGVTRSLSVRGSADRQRIPVGGTGRIFSVEIKSLGKTAVTYLQLEADVTGGGL